MAKAYLSDRAKRHAAGVEYIDNSTIDVPAFPVVNTVKAALAEDEARAILAETEPESCCPEAVTTHYAISTLSRAKRHPGIAFTLPHDIQAALAKSLAAFETMTVEQLAKLQED